MKKTSLRVLGILLTLIMLMGVIPSASLTVFAEDDPYHATGTCGSPNEADIEYYLFDDGSIAFFGTGAMQDFTPTTGNPAGPWYLSNPMEALMGSKIAIEDGITSVGNYAFYLPQMYTMFLQTYNVDLPNSLVSIGSSAFENQNKLEKISIPARVTLIGNRAFAGCTKLAHVDIYGDPSSITWGTDVFTQNVTCHIKPEYSDQLADLNAAYNSKNMIFEANLHADNLIDDGIERNIKAYMGQESSKIFCGAAPFIVIGTFSGDKKSVTRASNGFVSCVKIGNDYYLHTNNNSRNLNKVTIGTGGVATATSSDAHETLKLKITYDYIGTNIVRMVYHLENTGTTPINNVKLGGTGDIKIGADDLAKIDPLYKEEGSTVTNDQIGFYMKSTNDYDKDASGNYATLGFIGENVAIDKQNTKISESATYFYGKADANITVSDTGAYQLRLMPERIFNGGSTAQTEGSFPSTGSADSGMSYYWNVGTINAGETKEYAVLFSVYGTGSTEGEKQGQEMVEDLAAQYYTVTWKDGNGNDLLKQTVKEGDHPVYNGDIPTKQADGAKAYVFNNSWKDEQGESYANESIVSGDTTYTAQFTEIANPNRLFKGHALSLNGDIGVWFYLDKNEVETKGTNGNTAVVHFNWTVMGEEKKSDSYFTIGDGSTDKVTENGTTYYRVKCNVPAAEMSYNLHAVAYIDGKKHWDEDNYSVKEYGDYIIANSATYGEKLTDLAKEMLNYGAKSQIVFDRTDVDLANDDVTGYSMKNVTADMYDTAISSEPKNTARSVTVRTNMQDTTGTGLRYYGPTVVFLTKTSLRHYYTISNNTHVTEYTPYTPENTALSPTPLIQKESQPEFYYVEFTDIPAAELDVLQRFNMGGKTYYYSVLDYARAMFKNGSANEKNLAQATYLYNAAANEYFKQA